MENTISANLKVIPMPKVIPRDGIIETLLMSLVFISEDHLTITFLGSKRERDTSNPNFMWS